jgi:hypothetical protein
MTDLELATIREFAQVLAQHATALEQNTAILRRDVALKEAFAALHSTDDGKEAEAVEFIRTNPELSADRAAAYLAAKSMRRTKQWVLETRVGLGLPIGRKPPKPR